MSNKSCDNVVGVPLNNSACCPGARGKRGQQGPQGIPGPQGPPGEGVPPQGEPGQVLAKASYTDYDTEWVDITDVSAVWGSITGTLSNQTDLQAALNSFVNNATNTTLTLSGTGPYTLGLNLASANIWLAAQSVPDDAYGIGWNGSFEVPTKNAVYDKIESVVSGLSGYLTLDQTVPQTIVNGIPLLDADLVDFVNEKQLVTKEYVDSAVNFIADYYFNNTLSVIGGIYYEMTDNDLGQPTGILTATGLGTGNNQPLYNFITVLPLGVGKLSAGVYKVHVHARAFNGTKSVHIYSELYTRTTGGVETLLATSTLSTQLTNSILDFNLEDAIHNEVIIDPTDKLVVKFFANVGASGSAVDVSIYVEDDYNSRVSIPVESDILNQIYLRQDGTKPLTGDWNAGAYNITAANLSGVNTGDQDLTPYATKQYAIAMAVAL